MSRCEEVFKLLGIAARAKPCEGMKGIIREGDEATGDLEGSTLDAALIASAQKVEHYEIATYGTLATFAEVLDLQDAKDLLGQTLEEEKEADQKLTQIAESSINWEAEEGATEGEEEEEGESEMATAGAARSSGRAAAGRSKSSAGGRSRSKKR